MKRSFLAGFAGLLAAFLIVAVVEGISSAVYPAPPGFDPSNREALAKHAASLPMGAFVFVLVAWTLGALIGTFTAAKLTRPQSRVSSVVVAVLFLAACASNLIAIPHPAWFLVAAVLLVPAASAVGTRLGLVRRPQP